MATPFETEDTILTQEQADHINERHVCITKHPRASKFWLTFNLLSTLADLSQRTWEEDEDVQLLESGWKEGHRNYYLYVFAVHEIGRDPHGFSRSCVCYSISYTSLTFFNFPSFGMSNLHPLCLFLVNIISIQNHWLERWAYKSWTLLTHFILLYRYKLNMSQVLYTAKGKAFNHWWCLKSLPLIVDNVQVDSGAKYFQWQKQW